jgi:hypothetical protein
MNYFDHPDKRPMPEREADVHLPAEHSTRGISIWIAERLFRFEETDFCWTDISSSHLNVDGLRDPILYLTKVSNYDSNPIRASVAQQFLAELDSILLGSF